MEVSAIKSEGKREVAQWIQVLVPLRHVSLNMNVCGLCRCFRVGDSHEKLPLDETVFLDTFGTLIARRTKQKIKNY